MKKATALLVTLLFCINIVACQSSDNKETESAKDPSLTIQNNNFKDLGFSGNVYWSYEFLDMNVKVMFNQENPEVYYLDRPLLTSDIKSIEVKPNKEKQNQWLYLIYQQDKAMIDEEDIKSFASKGRRDAKENYTKKIKDINITTRDVGEFTIHYFNNNVRSELINKVQKSLDNLIQQIENKGYQIIKDDSLSSIITKENEKYKIVIENKQCIVVNADMDLSGGKKTGYMFNPIEGTGVYIEDDQTLISFRYSDSAFLIGQASLKQVTSLQEMKVWYDEFLKTFSTNTSTLQHL